MVFTVSPLFHHVFVLFSFLYIPNTSLPPRLADGVRLPRLSLQRVSLALYTHTSVSFQTAIISFIRTYRVVLRGVVPALMLVLAMRRNVVPDERLLSLDRLGIRVLQHAQTQLNIVNQQVAAALGKVLAHHHAQHLHLLRVRRHGIRGNHPAPRS